MAARKQRSTAPARPRHPEDKIVTLAKQQFAMADEATEPQRNRVKEALRFYAGDQWPEAIRSARDAQPARGGLAAVPARPCITVNKTREPVKQVLNLERQSDMGAEIIPADDFGEITASVNEDEIELREGLLRRIQRAPETADAITWGFSRSVIGGEGYFGIMTRYLKGKTFDQEPYVHRFFDQNSVLLDPAHEQPDGSDAEWAFVGTDMPFDRYKAEFPNADGKKNRVCDYDNDDFRVATEDAPGWFRTDGDLRMVRVVDYYYTERETTQYALMADGSVIAHKDVPEGVTPVDTRYDVTKKIKWCKLDGCQILEKTDWPGPDIPIVKIVGEELHPYDGERRIEGMVAPVIETNRAENYMVSKMVETIGLAPIPPLMMAAGQDEGFEAEYATMNTRTLGVLHYNHKDSEGTPVGPPTRPNVDTQIGPIAQAIQFFDEAIKSGTSTPDATLGNVDPSVRSGRAVKLLQQQAQLGTSNYLDNLARSVRRMGVILNGLFYPLYKRPGRLARIVTGSGESKTVTIGTPAAGGAMDQGAAVGSPAQPQKNYVLTEDANFNVAIKVTKNSETRNDQVNTMLGELIGANPEFMGWFGDLFLKTTDSPDAKELSERAKVMLAPPIQSMLAGKEDGQQPIPPEVQQKLAKAEEVIQGMTQQLEAMTKERETDGIKAQAAMQQTQADNAAKLQIEQLKAELVMAKEQLVNEFKMALEQFKATEAAKTREDEQKHELAMKAAEAAAKAEEAESARQHAAEMGEQSHIQALEQQENAPKPKAGA